MKRLTHRIGSNSALFLFLAGFHAGVVLPPRANAQYEGDLKTIYKAGRYDVVTKLVHGMLLPSPVPIGDLGNVETVVDLRGFVPMVLPHLVKPYPFPLNDVVDARWYKVPTSKALLVLYFGALRYDELVNDAAGLEREKFGATRFLNESNAQAPMAGWCDLAYKLAQQDAEAIFQKVAGSGFEIAEPTTVFFTRDSVFVILNFKYGSALMAPQKGQMLTALEFSRASRRYRTFYVLNTTLINRPTNDALMAAAPIVAKELAKLAF
jgi:hypothetical protein